MSCYNFVIRYYEKKGYKLDVQNLQGGKFKFKCSPTGLLKNLSYFKATKKGNQGVDDIVSLCMLLPCLRETGGAGLPRTAAILILVILAQVDLLAVVQLGVKADVLAGKEHGLDDLIAVVRAPAALGGVLGGKVVGFQSIALFGR